MELNPVLLHEWLSLSAARYAMKDAIVCGRDRWSYQKLNAYADCFADALIDLGVRRQDRVAVLLGNCAETVACLFGTLKAGATFVLLESNTKVRRLRHVLEDSGAAVIVTRASQARVLGEALEDWDANLKCVWVGGCPTAAVAGGIPGVSWEAL